MFGYDGKLNDFKVMEIGGMFDGSCLVFLNIFIIFDILFFCYEMENVF